MLVDAVTKEKPRVVGLLARWPGIRSCDAWERFGTGPKDINAVGRVMKGRQLFLFPEDLRDTAEVGRQSSGVSHRGLGGTPEVTVDEETQVQGHEDSGAQQECPRKQRLEMGPECHTLAS